MKNAAVLNKAIRVMEAAEGMTLVRLKKAAFLMVDEERERPTSPGKKTSKRHDFFGGLKKPLIFALPNEKGVQKKLLNNIKIHLVASI